MGRLAANPRPGVADAVLQMNRDDEARRPSVPGGGDTAPSAAKACGRPRNPNAGTARPAHGQPEDTTSRKATPKRHQLAARRKAGTHRRARRLGGPPPSPRL